VYPQGNVTTYSVSLLLNEDKDGADIPYSLDQMPRLLFISLHNFCPASIQEWLLLEL